MPVTLMADSWPGSVAGESPYTFSVSSSASPTNAMMPYMPASPTMLLSSALPTFRVSLPGPPRTVTKSVRVPVMKTESAPPAVSIVTVTGRRFPYESSEIHSTVSATVTWSAPLPRVTLTFSSVTVDVAWS